MCGAARGERESPRRPTGPTGPHLGRFGPYRDPAKECREPHSGVPLVYAGSAVRECRALLRGCH